MRLVEVAGASILIPQFPVESSLLLRFSVCSGDVGQDKVHSELGISHPKGMSTFGRRLWHFRSIALLPPACNNPPMNSCVRTNKSLPLLVGLITVLCFSGCLKQGQFQTVGTEPQSQSILFGPPPSGINVGGSFSVTARATSGLPVALASMTPAVCSLGQASTVGTCTIQGTQAGNAKYAAAAPVNLSFSIGGNVTVLPQTINFPAMPSVVVLAAIAPTATASSGLPVVITSTTQAICSTTQALTVGICVLRASQAGNAVYSAAAPVTQSFSVTNASQTITF